MPLYFIKPVVWNDQGYERPAGGTFTSGYPKENGFGHEEWNNSARLNIEHNGQSIHVFHTEGFGNQELDAFAGAIFVFMIASYQGRQFLVAVAGNATALFGDEHRKERLRTLELIRDAKSIPEEAWAVRSVRQAFKNDRSEFRARWNQERHWFAVWRCPSNLYLGLATPVELDPPSITGKKRLISMYGSYQEIDRPTALRLLDRIPRDESPSTVAALMSAIGADDLDIRQDLQRLSTDEGPNETVKQTLIEARLGQGKFRAQLNAEWHNACAVTGCSMSELLRASHIKPWRSSTNRERLDPANGILLTAHLDALFDSGLITFDDSGAVVASPLLIDDGNPRLNLGKRLRKPPSEQMRKYLSYHRERVFRNVPAQTG